jgi:hypothetical protein
VFSNNSERRMQMAAANQVRRRLWLVGASTVVALAACKRTNTENRAEQPTAVSDVVDQAVQKADRAAQSAQEAADRAQNAAEQAADVARRAANQVNDPTNSNEVASDDSAVTGMDAETGTGATGLGSTSGPVDEETTADTSGIGDGNPTIDTNAGTSAEKNDADLDHGPTGDARSDMEHSSSAAETATGEDSSHLGSGSATTSKGAEPGEVTAGTNSNTGGSLPADTGSATSPSEPQLTLDPAGLSRDQVRTLQAALIRQGARIEVDGVVGPETRRAIANLQKSKGLPPSAELDAQTLTALDLIMSDFVPAD